jgi:hypothetical protein
MAGPTFECLAPNCRAASAYSTDKSHRLAVNRFFSAIQGLAEFIELTLNCSFDSQQITPKGNDSNVYQRE